MTKHRYNTFGTKVFCGVDENGDDIEHSVHEYHDTLHNIYLGDFKESEHFEEFCRRTGKTDISFTKFREGALMCPCIQAPTMRVCVADEIETGFAELVFALKEINRRSRQRRNGEVCCMFCENEQRKKEDMGSGKYCNICMCGCRMCADLLSLCYVLDYIHPLASPVAFLNHLMCAKVSFPCMTSAGIPLVDSSVFQKPCALEQCEECALFARSEGCVLNCPTIFNDNLAYKWKEYMEHTLDNGNTIKELRPQTADVNGFRVKLFETLTKYKKHYFTYRWLNLCRKVDVLNIDGCSIYIQTDFSAQPVLDSQDKLNSQGHGVCVLCCWIVLHSPKQAFYENEYGEQVGYVYYECDHIRVVSPSTGKGKDQDWFLHCKIFDKIISHYVSTAVPNLNKVIVWTDGAPTQYKCRQNFHWLAQSFDRFDVKVLHRFAATAQFKGVHDKIGQTAKWVVR